MEEVEIRGEYWVQNGQVDFADGDIGDRNHEMLATEHVVHQYSSEIESLCDEYDLAHDDFDGMDGIDTEAVSKALWKVYELLTTGRDPDDEDEQKPPRKKMSPAKADKTILAELKCNADAYQILLGRGDSRLYVMKYDGWIAIRSHSVDVYGYTDQRRQEIASAISDVIYEELGHTDDEYDPEEVGIDIHDLKTNKHYSVTLAEMLTPNAPRMAVANVDDFKNNYAGKMKWASSASSRQDQGENMPQATRNKSVPNKWTQAAKDAGVASTDLWRGTSERVMPFGQWLEERHPDFDGEPYNERKTADDIRWPSDCNMKSIERKAQTDYCYVEPGGSHDKIKDRLTNGTVTVVPRHRDINPYTCKAIIGDIKRSCYGT